MLELKLTLSVPDTPLVDPEGFDWSVFRDSSTRGTKTTAGPPLTPCHANIFGSKLSSCSKKGNKEPPPPTTDIIDRCYKEERGFQKGNQCTAAG